MSNESTDVAKLGDTINKIGHAFEEYKKANDEALAEAKKGGITPEAKSKLDKLDAELDNLSELRGQIEKLAIKASRPGHNASGKGDEHPAESEYRSAFFDWLRQPSDAERQVALKQAGAKLPPEKRAAQTVTSTGSAGGFALPEIIERQIARLSVDISPIRQIATVRTVGSPDYKELFDVNGAAFEWVGEAGARSQTNTPDLAEVAPTFGTASARPRASEESLDDLFFNVEEWLQTSVAEAMAAGEGLSFVSGNGTTRPTGFLTGTPVATADAGRAFGVLQFIASGQAAAMPTSADVFYDVVYSLRARYRANARWVTSRSVLSAMRKYKDTTNQYLWQPSLSASQPESFMGYPITEAEDMPAVAANAFPLAFGDFREGYQIVDRIGLSVLRDPYTAKPFVKFYTTKRTGGAVVNFEAIKLMRFNV
jgi:HK97 family phage major capsid protein